MGQITEQAKAVYALGPASAPFEPNKNQIVGLFQLLEMVLGTAISGLVIGNSVAYATRAALFADLARAAGTFGIVYNDSTAANNGVYVKAGASGSGSWSLTGLALPSTFAVDLANVIAGLATEVAARTVTTNEVVAARSSSASLADRLGVILDTVLDQIEVQASASQQRDGELGQRIDAEESARGNLAGEITIARAGSANLSDRLAVILDAALDQSDNVQGYLSGVIEAHATASQQRDTALGQRVDAVLLAMATDAEVAAAISAALLPYATDAELAAAVGAIQAAATAAVNTADAALATSNSLVGQAFARPGDARSLFSSSLTGAALSRAPITAGVVVPSADLGSVLRIRGVDTDDVSGYVDVARRIDFALDPGRAYLVTATVDRNADPSDPANNAVEIRWQNLNANKASVSNVRLGSTLLPTVAGGPLRSSFLIGKTGAPGDLDYTIPTSAVYGLPLVRVYGNGAETDVASVDVRDVTDETAGGADIAEIIGRIESEVAAREALGTSLAQITDELEDRADAIAGEISAARSGSLTLAERLSVILDTVLDQITEQAQSSETRDAALGTRIDSEAEARLQIASELAEATTDFDTRLDPLEATVVRSAGAGVSFSDPSGNILISIGLDVIDHPDTNNTRANAETARALSESTAAKVTTSAGSGVSFQDSQGNRLLEVQPDQIIHPEMDNLRKAAALTNSVLVQQPGSGVALTDPAGNILIDFEAAAASLLSSAAGVEGLRLWELKSYAATVTVSPDGTKQFTSVKAAVESIADATIYKRYLVVVFPGVYTDIDWYCKDWVDIEGVDRLRCVLAGFLPDNHPPTDIRNHQTIWMTANCTLTNLTVTARNMRYPIHADSFRLLTDLRLQLINCHIEHFGNEGAKAYQAANGGDPNDVWASPHAWGCGLASGWNVEAIGTTFRSVGNAFYYHTEGDFTRPTRVSLVNSRCISLGIVANGAVRLEPLGSRQGDIFEMRGTELVGDVVYRSPTWRANGLDQQPSSHAEISVLGSGNSPAVFAASDPGKALRIESADTSSTSSVTVSGTAVAALFGGVNLKPGSGGIKGYAFGSGDISGVVTGYPTQTNITSLGVRLGDCTTVNKTLSVSFQGGAPINVVFNANHTAQSNATILALINAAIGASGVASEWEVGALYRPFFTDEETELRNNTTTGFLKGTVLARTSLTTIRAMTSSDPASLFAGVAWEDIYPGTWGRVKNKGYLPISDLIRDDATAITYDAAFSVSATNPGRVVVGGAQALFHAIRSDAVKFG